MRGFIGAVVGLTIGIAGNASAETVSPVLVELFTSQGCSACPPADAQMAELVQDPRVIALALHVDYWDYIGWKDEFGQAGFTSRQKSYARDVGSRMLYTPQFVINGVDRVEGALPERVRTLISEHAAQGHPVVLTLSRDADNLHILAEANEPLSEPVVVNVVRYRPHLMSEIKRGENAGMTISYHNIVTSWSVLRNWDGKTPLDMTAPITGDEQTVVVLQEEGPGAVTAVAQVH
ncbi:thioredoxin family protein [Falsirhodobacter sp. alg1]|uniref:DUF1223 domain-containing protein n=1 Tax=Falsirhodobacter sp. alg1 TaxID=1472418 RepID=UPI0005EFA3BF|nr:DUF1223 domain-containing protein [Falsirhodobacter sp. alg1]